MNSMIPENNSELKFKRNKIASKEFKVTKSAEYENEI